MVGKRINGMSEIETDKPCYWKAKQNDDDVWMLYLPGCGVGNLSNHTVEEYEDGTITVTPSILMTGHYKGQQTEVHGYLEKGVWRDC